MKVSTLFKHETAVGDLVQHIPWLLLITVWLALAPAALADGTIIYVDGGASGAATGLSWTDAFTNVQDALDTANTNGTTDYEIWVAEGVYYPDEDSDGDHTDNSRTESFRLNYNNVQLYGGFAGNETARDQRDWETHVTVLSGDIDENDINTDGNYIAETWYDIQGNNTYHVLWLNGILNEAITKTTVIDGFTITAGQADGSGSHDDGGGLYCDGSGSDNECSPTLTNIVFSGSQAQTFGGGMYNDGNSGISNPKLTNVSFQSNQAWSGGGMYNHGDSGTSSPALTNVTFNGNQATQYGGGGMYNHGVNGGTSSPALTNVTFSGNQAAQYGGGMYNYGGYSGTSNPALTNVTFSGNQADQGGGIYSFGFSGISSPALTNVIIWGNIADAGGKQLYNDDATPILSYTLIQSGTNDIHNTGVSTVTYGLGILTSAPRFVAPITATAAPTTAGNYRLQASSPAIDAGNNDAISTTTDLDGNPRFVDIPTVPDTGNGTPPIVDMGAYEAQLALQLVEFTPPRNAITAPLTAPITATYNQPLSPTTVSSRTFALHGMQSGLVTATHRVINGDTVIITPTRPFHQGELVYAVATTHTKSIAGASPLTPTQWQFNAGEVTHRCVGGFTEVYTGSLTGVYHSSVAWGDYDNDGDLDILLTGEDNSGHRISKIYQNIGNGFSEVYTGSLAGVWNSSVAWGDYDNDGDLDFLLTGDTGGLNPISKIYQNTGSDFSEVYTGSLTAVYNSSVAWGDYDNDGDLDILLTGYNSGGGVAKVHQNTGSGFSEVYAGSLTGVEHSSVAWGDYDNDGDLDFLLTGGHYYGSWQYFAQIYQNTGSSFSEVYADNLTGVFDSSVAWGDYDNDGDLDILIAGYTGSSHIAKIYQNTGSGFSEVYAGSLMGVQGGNVAWGDYDNDGDLDILLAGNLVAKVYQNTSSGFTEVYTGSLTGVGEASVAWGDYDNDGDLDILLTGYNKDYSRVAKIYRNDDCTMPSPVSVTITGPTTGTLNTTYAFTATTNPTVTMPITYRWEIGTSGSPHAITQTANLRIDTITATWHSTGTHVITVTASNAGGAVTTTHAITISAPSSGCPRPLQNVTLSGPRSGYVGTSYAFTGSLTPADVTQPVTLTWTPPPLSGQGTLTATYHWTTPSLYTLTLRAENCSGSVTATHRVAVSNPPSPPPPPVDTVTIHGPASGLVNTRYILTAAVQPITAAVPISYTWTPAPRNGQGKSWAEYVGTLTGPYPITVTAQNAGGIATDTHTLTLSESPAPCPTTIQDVTLLGPTEGYTGTAYAFTAVITPASATLPFTYTWERGHRSETSSNRGWRSETLSNRGWRSETSSNAGVTYTWDIPGTKIVTVTVANCGATVHSTQTLMIHPWPAPVRGDIYEPDDTCAVAAQGLRIPTDGTVQYRTFHAHANEDWVRFAATAGVTYTIQAQVPPTSPANLILKLYERCATGPIDSGDPAFSPAVNMTFVAPQSGDYFIQVFNVPASVYGPQVTYRLSVHALSDVAPTGALVIVAGKRSPGDPQQANIDHVAASVYHYALAHGCRPEDVYYLTTDATQPGSNGPPSRAALRHALTTWAASGDRVNADWPFTLFMVNHGDIDRFYLNGITETVSSDDLNAWLTQLENQTGARTNTVIEACHAGSFIAAPQTLSIPGRERVLIAATGVNRLAYASQDGALFSDALLSAFAQHPSLSAAFQYAEEATRQTRRDQTPWLDDNGDGLPNTETDGPRAALRDFACQPITSLRHAPYIAQVQIRGLSPKLHKGEVWARVLDDREVKQAWAVITPPSHRPATPGDKLTPSPGTRLPLHRQGNDWYGERYTHFNEVGLYSTVIYAKDDEGLLGQSQEIQVAVPEDYRHITPSALPTTLYIPIDGYTTTVEIPVGAFTATTTFTYTGFTDLSGLRNLTGLDDGLAFAGRGFDLTAYQYGAVQPGFAFQRPVTVTVRYSDADVVGLDESTLALHWLDGTTWRTTGLTITQRMTAANRLVIQATHAATFALSGQVAAPPHSIYLPLILRE